MTTSRMVVVLRGELGSQLSLAQKEEDKLLKLWLNRNDIPLEEVYKLDRKYRATELKVQRLQKAVHSLGALQLGDIEDKEL